MQSSLTGPTTPSDLLQQLHKSYGALTEAVNFSLGTGDTLITTDNGGYHRRNLLLRKVRITRLRLRLSWWRIALVQKVRK